MGRIKGALALVVFSLTAIPAAGTEFGHDGGLGCGRCKHCAAYGAPACSAPYSGLVPGCCEHQPSCCDDVWAGYCEEKARCRAWWQQFWRGTPQCHRHRVVADYRVDAARGPGGCGDGATVMPPPAVRGAVVVPVTPTAPSRPAARPLEPLRPIPAPPEAPLSEAASGPAR